MSSTSYPENAEDWRGRFIANLSAALARRKDVTLLLWAPPGDLPADVAAATTPADALWLGRLSQQGGIAHLLRTRRAFAVGTILSLLLRLGRVYRRRSVDITHVNWLQNALPLWGTKTPAVISVLGSDFGLLHLPGMKMALRTVFRQRRVILSPNAEWMRPMLEKAPSRSRSGYFALRTIWPRHLTSTGWPEVFNQQSDSIVPALSEVAGLSDFTSVNGVIHSASAEQLGFGPPAELDAAEIFPGR